VFPVELDAMFENMEETEQAQGLNNITQTQWGRGKNNCIFFLVMG
jgi:hypothetical protein